MIFPLWATGNLHAQSYDKLWKEVEKAQQSNLPKTVISLTTDIYKKAEREKRVGEMLKATVCKDYYQQRLTPDSTLSELQRWERLLSRDNSSEPLLNNRDSLLTKAVIHSLLAEKYANLMRMNSRTLRQRTPIEGEDLPQDIRQWSLPQFAEKIEQHLRTSLIDTEALLQVSARDYLPFTILEYGSKYYHHSLYHLLASRAITIYKDYKFQVTDYKEAIERLYESMIDAYSRRAGMDDAAFLSRLDYLDFTLYEERQRVQDTSRKEIQGVAELDSLIVAYGSQEVCAEAYIKKASLLSGTQPEVALEVCDEGLKRYPKYHRINALKNMRAEILQPFIHVSTEGSGYPGDSAKLRVSFKNLSGFSLLCNQQSLKRYELPASLTERDTLLYFTVPQQTGKYTLQVKPNVSCNKVDDCSFTVSRFKVLTMDVGDGLTEVRTLDASTGQPIAGAKVCFYDNAVNDKRRLLTEVTTDREGKSVFRWQNAIRSYTARKGSDSLSSNCWMRNSLESLRKPAVGTQKVVLLTDRSLYRPGQTVYIKGIAYTQYEDSARVQQNVDFELTLLDANRQKLSTQLVRSNEFGSFTTEFSLPASCLNGLFSVRTNSPQSSVSFRVEEYKRPTFEILFTPLETAYQLGDSVTLSGSVRAFNGRTVQDMPLVYRITRSNISYSIRNSEVPLRSDTILLDDKGNFSIPFLLERPKDNEETFNFRVSTFNFTIEASVTDEAGETQTSLYCLRASQQPFRFSLNIPSYLCKEDSVELSWSIANQSGIPQQNLNVSFEIDNLKSEIGNLETTIHHLPSGEYRLKLFASDSLGHKGEYESPKFILFSKADKRPPCMVPIFYFEENDTFDLLKPATFLFGTSFRDAFVMVDVFCENRRIENYTMQLSDSIVRMEFPYKEEYGDGLTVLLSFCKGGKVYSEQAFLKKRQPDRTLTMKWQTFRDRLQSGQQEEWRLVITNPQGMPAAAEMLATMYDASLDKLYKRNQFLQVFYPQRLSGVSWNQSRTNTLYFSPSFSCERWKVPTWMFDRFFSPIARVEKLWNSPILGTRMVKAEARDANSPSAIYAAASAETDTEVVAEDTGIETEESPESSVEVRTNFAETAFFYPQLHTNAEGEVVFTFTVPQSLTRWNFRGYAHTKDMLTGHLDASAVTVKEFMIQPNLPRYIRVGDDSQITAKIANLTESSVKGTATFTLFDPMTEKVISVQRQKFSVEAAKNATVSFTFKVTEQYPLLGVRVVADAGTFGDGEQHLLPVLSDKQYITETVSMPIRGGENHIFSLDSLFNHHSPTATERRLTVEFTGNPAWYAVQALPSLSQPTCENALSWAAAWYANSLAGHIANSQPRIKAVFDSWLQQGISKETLGSQLEKNEEVKNILLNESPWVLQATTEAEQRQRIASLFDLNQLSNRNVTAFTRLKELQNEDGGWSWYKGMPTNHYITGYVATLLVRLPLLTGQQLPTEAAAMRQRAFDYLHKKALEEYQAMRKAEKAGAKPTLSDNALRYLYLIGISGEEVPAGLEATRRYFLSKVKENLTDGSLYRRAISAIVLSKAGHTDEAERFIASLKEHLTLSEERGAYFAFHENPLIWGMQPVPVHVAVMEALASDGSNGELVEEMKLWLLKQKQVTAWNSPVATADAVYALLCRGGNLLENSGEVCITLDGKRWETSLKEVPGLNYVKQTFTQGSSELDAERVKVVKRGGGIAWGAVYAQFLSPLRDVKQQGAELSIEKKLYVERMDANGHKSLRPVATGSRLAVGDKVVCRLTVSLDRAMDFVQLKDGRGACFEPTGALSGFRWNNGLGYYMEVDDASTNFFFDHLGKGVYVIEHSCRISLEGSYEAGLATLQCAYAPEFSAHSSSFRVKVE